ncbi:MAG TPA: hypothetical protein VFA52_02270 [Candidatus Paceibacterota bacterium]|nr:hypothetical protein [Candidatus Paceibacterota bacterium]
MKTSRKGGLVGLLMTLIVTLIIFGSLEFNLYHDQPGGVSGHFWKEIKQIPNYWHSLDLSPLIFGS